MIFLFALVEPDKVTKAALKEEFVTGSINLTFLLLLIPPCVPDLRTFEQQEFVCDVMRWICMIRLFYTPGDGGGLPLERLASLRWSSEQTEWHRGRKGRDYRGQYSLHQTLLRPPAPRTPELQEDKHHRRT